MARPPKEAETTMKKLCTTTYFCAFAALWWIFSKEASSQAVSSQTLHMLQSQIDQVFQSKGAKCVTQISSGRDGTSLLSSYLPAIQISLLGHQEGMDSNVISASLELCPFVTASVFTKATTSLLLQILTDQRMPQKVLSVLYVQDTDHLTSRKSFFRSNPNSVVISPVSGKDNTRNSYTLWRPQVHPDFKLNEVAIWDGEHIVMTSKQQGNSKDDLPLLEDLLFDPAGLKLHGDRLTASAVAYAPFYIPGDGGGSSSGLEVELVETIVHSMGGKVEIGPPTDGGIWGNDIDGDGVFDGMVGDLQARRVDLGFSQLFVKQERMAFMDFTIQYDYDYTCFLVKKPPLLPQVLALIRPFDLITWTLIGCTMLAAIAFLLLDSNVYTSLGTGNDNALAFNLGASTLYVFSLAMMESHNYTFSPAGASMRAGIASVLLGFFILSRAFSSGLVAFLSVPLTQSPIDSLEEIAKSGIPTASLFGSEYLLSGFSANEHVLSLSADHRAFFDFSVAFANYSRGEIFLYQSRQFLENEIRTRLTDGYGDTYAHIARECPESFHVALGLTKHSPYAAPFNRRIRQLSEAGLIIKWTQDYMEQAGHLSAQSSSPTATVEPLMLDELVGPFQVFAGLLFACTVSLLMEILMGQYLFRGRSKKGAENVDSMMLKQYCWDNYR